MKTEITYATDCELTIADTLGWHWVMPIHFSDLKTAISMAEDIFGEQSIWQPEAIDRIFITDVNTGELLAECFHDESLLCDKDEPCEEVDTSELGDYDKVADQLIDLWL